MWLSESSVTHVASMSLYETDAFPEDCLLRVNLTISHSFKGNKD
jgi:hypothetical protein